MRFLQFVYVTSKRERNNCSRLLKQPSNHWTPSDIQDVGKRLRDRQIKCSEEAWRTGITVKNRHLFFQSKLWRQTMTRALDAVEA